MVQVQVQKIIVILLLILVATLFIKPIYQHGGMVCGDTSAGYVPCPAPGMVDHVPEWDKLLNKELLISSNIKGKDCGLQWSGTAGSIGGVGSKEHAAKFDCGNAANPMTVTKKGENYYIKNAKGCGLQWSGLLGQSTPVGNHERVAKFDCENEPDPMLIEGTPDKFYIKTQAKDQTCGFVWADNPGGAKGVLSEEYLAKFNCDDSQGFPLSAKVVGCDCPDGFRPAPEITWTKKYTNKWPNCTNHPTLGCTDDDLDTMKQKCAADPDCDGFSITTSGKSGCYKTKCRPDNVAGYGQGEYNYYEKQKNEKNRCIANWSSNCGEGCAKNKCLAAKGAWIPFDYWHNPYTCDMPCTN